MAPKDTNNKWPKHVLANLDPSAKDFDRNQTLFECKEYLIRFVSTCIHPDRRNDPTKCGCMKWVKEDENSSELDRVTLYIMIYWAGIRKEGKNALLLEWQRRTSLFQKHKDRKSTRLNSSHALLSRMPSSA